MSITNSLPSANAHFISVQLASAMTARYLLKRETVLNTEYQNQDLLPLSEAFNRDVFDELLNKPDCAGLRIYYGIYEELKVHAIIVAAEENNPDILPQQSVIELETNDHFIGEEGQRCPNGCPSSSPLNN